MLGVVFAILFLLGALFLFSMGTKQVNGTNVHFRLIALIPGGFGLLILLFCCFTSVPVGQVGIPVAFGHTSAPLSPGIHFINPFADVKKMNLRTQQYTMVHDQGEGAKSGDDSVGVLGSDGGTADVDATLLFHVDRESASTLYKKVGTAYINQIVRPAAKTCVRNGFTKYDIVSSSTIDRSEVETAIHDCLESKMTPYGLALDDLQIRHVALAANLQTSVNNKIAAQQAADQKVFELQQADGDARIKTVGAKATADAQQIVACGGQVVDGTDVQGNKIKVTIPNDKEHCNQAQLTQPFLEYSYIQALLAAANSPNHSTFVLPSDSHLTPFLNTSP